MSQENVEIARQLLVAVGERDLSALLRLTDPQVEWRSFFAALQESGEYHGHDAMSQYLSDLDDAFEFLQADAMSLLDVGDVVIGVGRIRYRGESSGVEMEVPSGWMFKFRDGKAIRFRAFREPEEALEAVGLADG
jgi:ketosteroid isomerase-like protein